MTALFRVGERAQYYAKKYDVTVVAGIMELPNRNRQVKIKVLDSHGCGLEGQEWSVAESWLLKADGQPRAFLGGEHSWEDSLEEIRDRVLHRLPPHLKPMQWTEKPRKELSLAYDPEGVSYRIWMHPRDLELKLTLGITDKAKRDLAYDLLREQQSRIEAALGLEIRFNWRTTPPRTVSEEISWPGEDGPGPAHIDRTVDRLILYITTLQPMLSRL